ncbi:hypothetical protein R4575_18005 [Acinetobacter baumannii]|nr:hypothetical protein [Acinetobacter baumannii]
MSFNNHSNHPQALEIKNFFHAIPLLMIVILVLSFMIYKGRQLNKNLTETDIINYTTTLGTKNDCYFENIKVTKDSKGKITMLTIKGKDAIIASKPIFDAKTNEVLAFKVNPSQIMYCTKGGYNYVSPIITTDRILAQLPESQAKEKSSKFDKELSNKYIDKIGNYLTK